MGIPANFFNVSFNKAMAFGYRTDDVDEFVTQALNIAKELQGENEALHQKLEVLASNLENYREEEDSLRSALIGAQKLGDSILKDSRQKAEKIINDAAARANQITTDAAAKLDKQQYELEQIQAETVEFKEKIFSLYRTHLDIIKNIPTDYDDNRKKPRPKTSPPAQPAAAEPEPHKEEPVQSYNPSDLPKNNSYDERSSAVYTPDYAAPQNEQYEVNDTDIYTDNETASEQPIIDEPDNINEDVQEDYFKSPFIIDEPDSDKPFTVQPPYAKEPMYEETYNEPYEDLQGSIPVIVMEASEPEEDDISIYHAPPRRVEESHPFATPPMVQLEFDTGDYDEYEDDEFAAEKKLIREANLNRIPYLDDDDDDGFAVQLTAKKKPVVSQKFGVLKFGDSFDLRDD